MRHDHLVIILPEMTYVYKIQNLEVVDSVETGENLRGIGCITNDKDRFVMICPDVIHGKVHVENYFLRSQISGQIFDDSTPIQFLSISNSGDLAAASNADGTMLHVFDPVTLQVDHVLRRGASAATITGLHFNPGLTNILLISNKGTMHLWSLDIAPPEGMFDIFKSFISVKFSGRNS
jgi:WD40 repeat protein